MTHTSRLIDLLERAEHGERRALFSCARNPGRMICVPTGTSADRLWRELSLIGWARPVASPPEEAAKRRTYAITRLGARAVVTLGWRLEEASARRIPA